MQSISIHRTTFQLLCLLLLAAGLSGCFEVREEVNIKEDGSGEMTVVFDLSKSKGKVKQYMKMESLEGYPDPFF